MSTRGRGERRGGRKWRKRGSLTNDHDKRGKGREKGKLLTKSHTRAVKSIVKFASPKKLGHVI